MKGVLQLLLIVILCLPDLFAQNVGIGTSNPGQKLDVSGWIRLGSEISSGTDTEGSLRYHSGKKIQFHDGIQWVDILSNNNADDDWRKVGGGVPTISDDIYHSGNVGIGTSSPSARLEISGVGGGTVDLKTTGRIWSNSSSGGLWLNNTQDGFVGNNSGNIGFWTAGAGWNALQIVKSSGYVGIGTSSPGSRLHLRNDAAGTVLTIQRNDGFPSTYTIANSGNLIVNDYDATGFTFSKSGSEVMRITASGVSIGTQVLTGYTLENRGNAVFKNAAGAQHTWFPYTNGYNYISGDRTYIRSADYSSTMATFCSTCSDALTIDGGRLRVNNSFVMQDGTQANGRVMRSNASGVASWVDVNSILPSTNSLNGTLLLGDIRISWGESGSSLCDNATRDIALSNFSAIYNAQVTPQGNSSADKVWPLVQSLSTTNLRVRAQTPDGSCMDGFYWLVIGRN